MSALTLRTLGSLDALHEALSRSSQRRQLIFKHSNWCPLSSQALAELERYLQAEPSEADYWLITVQTERPISDAVEERLAVRHESPQALLVERGAVVWHASHRRITLHALSEALASARS